MSTNLAIANTARTISSPVEPKAIVYSDQGMVGLVGEVNTGQGRNVMEVAKK
jgi:hypothetical protein